jgi:glycosyltransferase involved in cell wall biosynthesis
MSDAEFLVLGPTDHDKVYTSECMSLAQSLGLDSMVFAGEVAMDEQYPEIDLVVLTSLSEALPFAVLEAFAHGIPAVVTDVGGCRELVSSNGHPERVAGTVCPVGNHARIADAIVELCSDPFFYRQCAEEGVRRVREIYSEDSVMDSYREIYARVLNGRRS